MEPQEIRNCSARMIGEEGIKFYSFLVELSIFDPFERCVESLSQTEKEKKGAEELVLRFLATKNAQNYFKGSVRDWLDDYMEKVIFGELKFNYEKEKDIFKDVFQVIYEKIGRKCFFAI